jgi:hypothetical protein
MRTSIDEIIMVAANIKERFYNDQFDGADDVECMLKMIQQLIDMVQNKQ